MKLRCGALLLLIGISAAAASAQTTPTKTTPSPATINSILSAYLDRARVAGDNGAADSALAIIASARRDHPEIPAATADRWLAVDELRYGLVGRDAPAIEAPHWTNAPSGTTNWKPTGKVTLMQFTAHWCAPCQTSYDVLNTLSKRFGDKVQIVLVTELYGQFKGRIAKPVEELQQDSVYYAEAMKVPYRLAISDQPPPPIVPGTYGTGNTDRYGVGPLPQIVLIDAAGVVRQIFVGGDFTSAQRIERAVLTLLPERSEGTPGPYRQ